MLSFLREEDRAETWARFVAMPRIDVEGPGDFAEYVALSDDDEEWLDSEPDDCPMDISS